MILHLVAFAMAGPTVSADTKVFLADRVDLVTTRVGPAGAAEIARETLYDNGFAPPSMPDELAPWLPECQAAALGAGTVRWLDFSAQRDEVSGVEESQGEWSSLSPDFDTVVADVREALAWRAAAVAGKLDASPLRSVAAGQGLRAYLAWNVLANPQWHEGHSGAGGLPMPRGGPSARCR